MPELPDIELYVDRLQERLTGERVERFVAFTPFVVRSVSPKPAEIEGLLILGVSRLGKRLVIEMENEMFLVIHLMISGRLQWQSPLPPFKRANGKIQVAALRVESGQLTLVEFSTKKRASVNFVKGREALVEHSRGGIDVLSASAPQFEEALKSKNRTLKRALTDPRSFDGIGNAYSDEILFTAKLSPMRMTTSLSDVEVARLLTASRDVLSRWIADLKKLYPKFPKPGDITAFRPNFAVHGRFNQPCIVCNAPIQHIVYADNETNYCARCQNEGRLLADRSLSRLLKEDWPKTLEED